MKRKNVKKKRMYNSPELKEKPMAGSFMGCSKSRGQCPPGTAIKAAGSCFAG